MGRCVVCCTVFDGLEMTVQYMEGISRDIQMIGARALAAAVPQTDNLMRKREH